MSLTPLVIGIDVGTSGVRAAAMESGGAIAAQAASALSDFGADYRDPGIWWKATHHAVQTLLASVEPNRVRALAVDGTSGTMVAIDATGRPAAPALMYNDPVEDPSILAEIGRAAPPASAAHGPTSGLAKLIRLQRESGVARVIHQADWIAAQFSGRFDLSDENNALKTGYDPVERRWPDWINRTVARRDLLPEVIEPGTAGGEIRREVANAFGLGRGVLVVAGTTDGCASFLATGATELGEAVTALGTTLTLKMLCDRPLFAPEYGLYSHRLGTRWLAGGASNSGGAVLAHFFPSERIAALSAGIDPSVSTGLSYYPLIKPGERFPINDPNLPPRLQPRPDDDVTFLQGILEGIATVERLGYDRLAELGSPALRSVRTVGGGARNAAWTQIRRFRLGVPFLAASSEEAAAGTARLAFQGARRAGLL